MFTRNHMLRRGAHLNTVVLLRGVVLFGALSLGGVGAQETTGSASSSASPAPTSTSASTSPTSTSTTSAAASATSTPAPSATPTGTPCPPGQTCAGATGHGIKPRLPTNAKLAIAFVCIFTVLLFLTFLLWYLRRHRATPATTGNNKDQQGTDHANEGVTDIEARQMAGPPTVLAATYNPATGSPSVYTIGSAGSEEHWTPVNVQTPVRAAGGFVSSYPAALDRGGVTGGAGGVNGRVVGAGMMEMPSGPVAPYTPGGSRAAGYPFVGMGSSAGSLGR